MARKQLPHMICTSCGAKVDRDAYYCRKCESVVDALAAPGMKREDTRLLSRLISANKDHLFRNAFIGIFILIFIITGIEMGSKYLSVAKDNNSSPIFQLIVDAPTKPVQCSGPVCHLLIDIKNKSGMAQMIDARPTFIDSDGQTYPASDPTLLGTGTIYCEPEIKLTLAAHAEKKYIGVCVQGAPHNSSLTLVRLNATDGSLIVSGRLATPIP